MVADRPLHIRTIILFILALAVGAFIVRFWFFLSWTVPVLGMRPGMCVQYLGMYIAGIAAYRYNWFQSIPSSFGKVGIIATVVGTIILFPIALSGNDFGAEGGLHWQSLVYTTWEAILCVGMCLALLVFFRRFFARNGRWRKFLASHAYVVYLVHAPVLVALGYAFSGLSLYSLLKWILVAFIAIPCSFLCGALVRKLPFARTIL
jgi:peptidoglycan/LPS O-acetylase OafA/YrhL